MFHYIKFNRGCSYVKKGGLKKYSSNDLSGVRILDNELKERIDNRI